MPAMERIRVLWKTDRGRLAHYLVASTLAIAMVVESLTLDGASGWLVVVSVVGAVALLHQAGCDDPHDPYSKPRSASGATPPRAFPQ